LFCIPPETQKNNNNRALMELESSTKEEFERICPKNMAKIFPIRIAVAHLKKNRGYDPEKQQQQNLFFF